MAGTFDVTPDVAAALAGPLSDSTARAVAEEADRLEVRWEALPEFLQTPTGQRLIPNTASQRMQEMQAREVDQARYRASRDHVADAELKAVLQCMRDMARTLLPAASRGAGNQQSLAAAPGSASITPAEFLEAAHHRSLAISKLKQKSMEGQGLRKEYSALLARFPAGTVTKVREEQLATQIGRAIALTQLVAKHTGDSVELDRTRALCILRPAMAPGSASAGLGEQWFCVEGGNEIGSEGDFENGPPGSLTEAVMLMDLEKRSVLEKASNAHRADLDPDWGKQSLRATCPCTGAARYVWRRVGHVATIGEFFLALGRQWPASSIYDFYRTLRIVALKRRKGMSAAPASGRVAGVTHSSLQAAQMRRSVVSNKDLLVEEYVAAKGLGGDALRHAGARAAPFDETLMYLHVTLPRDLRPPWLTHNFSQALPEEGVLSR